MNIQNIVIELHTFHLFQLNSTNDVLEPEKNLTYSEYFFDIRNVF